MWYCSGMTPRAPGTFFYNKGRAFQTYWHMYDQVLLDLALVDPVDA